MKKQTLNNSVYISDLRMRLYSTYDKQTGKPKRRKIRINKREVVRIMKNSQKLINFLNA